MELWPKSCDVRISASCLAQRPDMELWEDLVGPLPLVGIHRSIWVGPFPWVEDVRSVLKTLGRWYLSPCDIFMLREVDLMWLCNHPLMCQILMLQILPKLCTRTRTWRQGALIPTSCDFGSYFIKLSFSRWPLTVVEMLNCKVQYIGFDILKIDYLIKRQSWWNHTVMWTILTTHI